MSAFTNPSSWEHAQKLASANEIVLAYSERRQVLGQSAVSALSSGNNAQDKTLWLAMQNWLEANCTSFINHVNGPLNPAGTAFLPFTLATWRTAAGLNVNGFRRSIDDGSTMLYGKLQAGDTRGKWCFEDLQKGFSALKWTITTAGTLVDGGMDARIVWPSGYSSCAAAKTAVIAAYNAGPTGNPPGGLYRAFASVQYNSARNDYGASAQRQWGSIATIGLYDGVSHTAYFYARSTSTVGGSSEYYEDMDGLFNGKGVYTLFQSLGAATTSARTSNPIGGISSPSPCPLEISSFAICPVSWMNIGDCKVDAWAWLLKWDFTNA